MKQNHPVFLGGVLIGLATAPGGAIAADPAGDRQAEVARRGATVMPFDLERTQHIFTPTASGGIQQVVTRQPADVPQRDLIRQHLRELAERFGRRDFSGPATIHGDGMPGLARLRAAPPGALAISYEDLEQGGQLTYASADPEIVQAIHDYFAAQLSDHGRHAVGGHPPGMTHGH